MRSLKAPEPFHAFGRGEAWRGTVRIFRCIKARYLHAHGRDPREDYTMACGLRMLTAGRPDRGLKPRERCRRMG